MLKQILIDGKIPYLTWIRRALLVLALVTPLAIFAMPYEFGEFGEIGWQMLIAVMVVRPLADLFPKIKLLRTLVLLRKEIGIWSALLILAHVVGYLIVKDISIVEWIMQPSSWSLSSPMGWGTIGTVAVLPVLLTSNKFSIIKLKRWWKRVQKLTYLFFIGGAVHIILLGEEEAWAAVILVSGLMFAAWFKKKYLSPNPSA